MDTAYSNRVGGFTKLFSTIIDSTVWRTDLHVKVVWITILAKADRNGRVWASVPGLAVASGVTLDQCVNALECLSSPDEWSRTKTHEGRRIAEVDGGWEILNYLKYRELRSDDERRLQTRAAVAKYRVSKKSDVSHGKPMKAQAEAEAEADPEAEKIQIKSESAQTALVVRAVPEAFTEFWALYPRKVGKIAARKAWRSTAPEIAAVRAALAWQVTQPGWVKDAGEFIPHPATWLNQRRWEDEPFHPPAGMLAIPTTTKVGRNVNETKAAEEYFNGKLGAR